jgi:hypothetical protein
VKVTAVPVVPVAGPDIVTVRGKAAIVTVADAVAVFAGDSLSVKTTLIVLEPLTEYVVVKLAPVPEAGEPPVAVQANE